MEEKIGKISEFDGNDFIFPFIFIQSGVKPIVNHYQIHEFEKASNMIINSDELFVLGYGINNSGKMFVHSKLADYAEYEYDELMELLNTFPNDYIRDFLNNICHLISNTYIGQSEMYNKLQTFDTDATFRDVFGDPRLDDIIKRYIKDEFICNIKSHIYPNTYENYGEVKYYKSYAIYLLLTVIYASVIFALRTVFVSDSAFVNLIVSVALCVVIPNVLNILIFRKTNEFKSLKNTATELLGRFKRK